MGENGYGGENAKERLTFTKACLPDLGPDRQVMLGFRGNDNAMNSVFVMWLWDFGETRLRLHRKWLRVRHPRRGIR